MTTRNDLLRSRRVDDKGGVAGGDEDSSVKQDKLFRRLAQLHRPAFHQGAAGGGEYMQVVPQAGLIEGGWLVAQRDDSLGGESGGEQGGVIASMVNPYQLTLRIEDGQARRGGQRRPIAQFRRPHAAIERESALRLQFNRC